MESTLECVGLTIGVNGRTLVEHLDLSLEPGAMVFVLGPNGVGKTLTVHTMAGLRESQGGDVRLHGKPMAQLDRPAIARRLGLLLQRQEDAFPTTVLETALMGCHPRLNFWQWETSADVEMAHDALRSMDLTDLSHRMTATLSGGERQRLALSTLFVQNPDVMLLDEPLNHLDPLHKLAALEKLTALADQGRTIVATLHDPVLAAKYSRAVLLLFGDGSWDFGPTQAMLTPDKLERLYGTPFEKFTRDNQSVFLPAHAP